MLTPNRIKQLTYKNIGKLSFITTQIVIAVGWLLLYRSHSASPAPLGTHPAKGWWGWFDQGEYLKITEQFTRFDFFNPDKYYPPLYPALPSLLHPLTGATLAYLFIDLACTLVFFGLLFFIFKRYINPILALSGVVISYGFTLNLYNQWIIPWTTNLSSVFLIIIAYQLQCLNEESKTNQKLQLDRINYFNPRITTSFCLAAGIIWLRPFEIIPAGILSLGIIWTVSNKLYLENSKELCNSFIKTFMVPLGMAILIVFLYGTYNVLTFGSLEPSYSKSIGSLGFNFQDIHFKFASLVNDSSSFGINDGAITNVIPWFLIMAAIAFLGVFLFEVPIKLLIISAFISSISYLAFNDLVPTGLLTYSNIHYFTWSIAVIGVAAIASVSVIIYKGLHNTNYRRKKMPFVLAYIIILPIILGSVKPQTNRIFVTTPEWQITCPLNQAEGLTIHEFKMSASPPASANKSLPNWTRQLDLEIATSSQPENLHLAHADQVSLIINNTEQAYRKDWRIVSYTKSGQNFLSILLQKPANPKTLNAKLTINNKSNVDIPQQDLTCEHKTRHS